MKKFIILSAVASVLALIPGKTFAADPKCISDPQCKSVPPLNISGVLEEVGSNYVNKAGVQIQTAQCLSFNNAAIYLLISNAVAQGSVSGISPENLPATGYIVYDPAGNDGALTGTFSVTNAGGFSFPLSGIDNNGDYYSYVELDTDNQILGVLGFDLGLTEFRGDDFNNVYSNDANTQEDSSTAVFYVHDNPYAYDAADSLAWTSGFLNAGPQGLNSPNPTSNNFENSIEIKGILTADVTTTTTKSNKTTTTTTTTSAEFHGKGNALVNGAPALVMHSDITYQ